MRAGVCVSKTTREPVTHQKKGGGGGVTEGKETDPGALTCRGLWAP